MRILQIWLMLAALTVVGSALGAQTWTWGPINTQFTGGGSVATIGLDVAFAAGGAAETWDIDVTASTDAGCAVFFTDVTRSSGNGPATFSLAEWDNANPLVGVAAAGQGGGSYTTPAYSGTTQRFSLMIIPFDPGGTFPCDVSVTITNQNGTSSTPTSVQGFFSDNYAPNIGTSGNSAGYIVETMHKYDANLSSALVAGANDEIQFDFSVDFGTGAAQSYSLWANAYSPNTGGGSGNLEIELWDLTSDGFSDNPTMSMTLNSTAGTGIAGGEQDALAGSVPATHTGVHDFRLIIRPGSGFTADLRAWWQFSVDSTADTVTLLSPDNDARQAAPRLSISPAGSSISSTTTLTASGGTTPVSYTWAIQGTPPTGWSLSGNSGTSVDLQAGSGSGSVTVRVTNGSTGEWAEETYTVTGGGGGNPLAITGPASLPNGVEQAVYTTTTITASGGSTPYTWSATGLPTGLSIDSSTGEISGTPDAGTATGSPYTVVVEVDDGTDTDTETYTLSISAAGTLTITTTSLPSGTEGSAYGPVTVQASGGSTPYTWSATGLPGNLTIDPTTGTISGTPNSNGTFNVTVTVDDGTNNANENYSLVINAAGGGGPGGGGLTGGGGGGGGGCAASAGHAPWLMLIALLGLVAVGARRRREA